MAGPATVRARSGAAASAAGIVGVVNGCCGRPPEVGPPATVVVLERHQLAMQVCEAGAVTMRFDDSHTVRTWSEYESSNDPTSVQLPARVVVLQVYPSDFRI